MPWKSHAIWSREVLEVSLYKTSLMSPISHRGPEGFTVSKSSFFTRGLKASVIAFVVLGLMIRIERLYRPSMAVILKACLCCYR